MNKENMGEWQEFVRFWLYFSDKELKGFADGLEMGCERKRDSYPEQLGK